MKAKQKIYRKVFKTTRYTKEEGGGMTDEYVEIHDLKNGRLKMIFGSSSFIDHKRKITSSGSAHAAFYSRSEITTMLNLLKKVRKL